MTMPPLATTDAPTMRESSAEPAPLAPVPPQPKRLLLAYLWWLPPMGFVGGHRFYLRRWYTGTAWALSSGLLWVGWLADLFLLPLLVRKTNAQLAAEFAAHPEHFIPLERPIATWAQRESPPRWEAFAEPFSMYWYILAPSLLALMAYEMHLSSLVPIMLVVLIAAGFFVTSVDQILQRYPVIVKLPGVSHALVPFRELLATYQEHRPSGVRVVRRLFTRETLPYLRILGIVMVGVLVETATSFKSVYLPFLTMEDAASGIAVQLVLAVMLMSVVFIPVFTTSFRYSLSGRQTTLRRVTVVSLVIVVGWGLAYPYLFDDRDAPTLFAAERLILRFEKPDFMKSLRQLTEMFLVYPDEARRETTPEKKETRFTRFAANIEAWFDHPKTRSNEPELTRMYRSLLKNLVPEVETRAFQIERAVDPGGTPWRVATWRPDSTEGETKVSFVIAARDSAGAVYRCDPVLKFAAHSMVRDSVETIEVGRCATSVSR